VPALVLHSSSFPRWRERLPAALEIALVLLLATQAARLVWIALAPTGPFGTRLPGTDDATATTAALATHGDLFFRQVTAATAGGAAALGYTLFGVRAAGAHGSAILGKDGVQHAYRIGDALAPGLLLDAVAADHVVLRNGATRHRLEMSARSLASTQVAAALPSGRPLTGAPSASAVAPGQLLAQAGLRAHEDGGYAVIPRGDGALLRRAGLEAGDVVLAVDGESLTPERLGELPKHLQGRDQATLTIRRDGTTRTVTLGAGQP